MPTYVPWGELNKDRKERVMSTLGSLPATEHDSLEKIKTWVRIHVIAHIEKQLKTMEGTKKKVKSSSADDVAAAGAAVDVDDEAEKGMLSINRSAAVAHFILQDAVQALLRKIKDPQEHFEKRSHLTG